MSEKFNPYIPANNFQTSEAHDWMKSAKAAKRGEKNSADRVMFSEDGRKLFIADTVTMAKKIHRDGMEHPHAHPTNWNERILLLGEVWRRIRGK